MILSSLVRAAERVAVICASLAGGTVIALATFLFADVVGRAFGRPLFGAQDIAEMAMIVATFGAVALLDRKDGQIRVDLLSNRLSARIHGLTDRLSALLGVTIYLALAWTLFDAAELSALLSLSTNILGLPKAPFQYLLAGLALVAALNALLRGILPADEVSAHD